MSSPDLISVVIPVYNQAAFAVEAVDSVLCQSHPNVQVIVVDDGSTDDSAERVAAAFGNRVQLIRQANQGPSSAVNAGLRAVRGRYIALLGGDDVCLPDRLAQQREFLESQQQDIVFAPPFLINEKGEVLDDEEFLVFFRQPPDVSALFKTLFIDGNFLCAPSAFLRADVVHQLGLFKEGLIQLQDYEYWLRALIRGLKIKVTPTRVVKYRRHSSNLSSAVSAFASKAENAAIIQSIVHNDAAAAVLRAALGDCLVPTIHPHDPLSAFDKTLLLLGHPDNEVRAIGVAQAIELFEDKVTRAYLDEHGVNLIRLLRNSTVMQGAH